MIKIALSTKIEKRALFNESARQLKMTPAIIEKDFWVCFILNYLFNEYGNRQYLTFKGGTSLSKCYDVIQRFSEDIDLNINNNMINITDDYLWTERSNKAQTKIIDEVYEKTNQYLVSKFIPLLRQYLKSIGLKDCLVEINPNNFLSVLVSYPQVFDDEYIPAQVNLEFGVLGGRVPSESKQVTAYIYAIAELANNKCEFSVTTIEPKRTFFDKLTILHAETSRQTKHQVRYARHYYDVYMLSKSDIYHEALKDIDLLREVIKSKNKFFHLARANYDAILAGQLRLVPSDEAIEVFAKDYDAMKNMLFGQAPTFEEIIDRLREIEVQINQLLSYKNDET